MISQAEELSLLIAKNTEILINPSKKKLQKTFEDEFNTQR